MGLKNGVCVNIQEVFWGHNHILLRLAISSSILSACFFELFQQHCLKLKAVGTVGAEGATAPWNIIFKIYKEQKEWRNLIIENIEFYSALYFNKMLWKWIINSQNKFLFSIIWQLR